MDTTTTTTITTTYNNNNNSNNNACNLVSQTTMAQNRLQWLSV